MDFIGTGNRILTENFVIGYLYTITFKTGIYINSACIGKGTDFVMFQRAEPDLLFTLNMTTASDVYTIELYSSGGGSDDYEALSNKPQINNVTLSGNKSSSDLGLQDTISDLDTIRAGAATGATAVQPDALSDYQPVISDLDTIRAGAAAGATAVQPAALSDYQPVISDLDTIRAGAAAGATAVQPAALSDYQSKIDSTHMLSADLVDDTSTTNKFATAAELQQIETNKTNISSITPNTVNVIKNAFTATNWTKIDELAFEIPVGKIAQFVASATRDTNEKCLGIAFVRSDTFSYDDVLAISENPNALNYFALSCAGIRSRIGGSAETINVFVKYSGQVSTSITRTYTLV